MEAEIAVKKQEIETYEQFDSLRAAKIEAFVSALGGCGDPTGVDHGSHNWRPNNPLSAT